MSYQKFKSQTTVVYGRKFASKLEAQRFQQLRLMLEADPPLIAELELQPEFQVIQGYVNPVTGEKIKSAFYVGDFQYLDLESGKRIVEDTKGFETDSFKIKWKLVQKQYRDREFRKLTRKDV